MNHTDVEDTLDMALAATGVQHVAVNHRPRLLSDNGAAYISAKLVEYYRLFMRHKTFSHDLQDLSRN